MIGLFWKKIEGKNAEEWVNLGHETTDSEKSVEKIKERKEKEQKKEERIMEDLPLREGNLIKRICVIGVGSSGTNTVQRLTEEGIFGAELFAVNTDAQHLLFSKVERRLLIGKKTTRGLAAGSIPRLGEEAIRENITDIKSIVEDADMALVAYGLGGGTGTGAAPVVAQAAREAGALTIGVVTLPFSSEGEVRTENTVYGLKKIREATDTLIVIPNDKLLDVVPRLALNDAFRVADDAIISALKTIELIVMSGIFSFEDLRKIIQKGYLGFVGFGEADGENKLVQSIGRALINPLIDIDLSQTSKALVYITGDASIKPSEVKKGIDKIAKQLYLKEDNIIWGTSVNHELKNTVRTAIIATDVKSLKENTQLENKDGSDLQSLIQRI